MTTVFPDRTAILAIHGIGEQNPFETLDAFARGLKQQFSGERVELHHLVAGRRGADGSPWRESAVRIQERGIPDRFIDIHEFYWAYLTEDRISIPEIHDWAKKTLRGTRRFYQRHPNLREGLIRRRGSGSLPIARLSWLLFALRVVQPLVHLVQLLLIYLVPFGKPLQEWLRGEVFKPVRRFLLGYVGDIAIYTTMDKKSKHHRLREHILDEALAIVSDLVERGDGQNPPQQYDRVILAGHSLGSVIAFDTLNRLNIKANLDAVAGREICRRIAGLITFGSPLDKIAFFFREDTSPEEYLRAQIIRQLHSFKANPTIDGSTFDLVLTNHIQAKLDHIPWRNYFHRRDPVSGHLDSYCIGSDDNVLLNYDAVFWTTGHTQYWRDEKFYRDIVGHFFARPTSPEP